MVDSGSVDDVADVNNEFPDHTVKEGKAQQQGVKYVAAGGAEIPNEGESKVTLMSDDGFLLPQITFQNAKVGMPIMSVRRLVRKGSKVEFEDDGGTITLPCGKTVTFKERHGVYFVKLYVVPPENNDQPGFTGLGS